MQFKGGAIEFDRDKYCPTLGNAWVEVVCSVQFKGGGAQLNSIGSIIMSFVG